MIEQLPKNNRGGPPRQQSAALPCVVRLAAHVFEQLSKWQADFLTLFQNGLK